MLRPVLFLLLSIIIAASCQKEVDVPQIPETTDSLPEVPGDDLSPDNGGLLKRQIWKASRFDDSVFINFIYDDRNRLIEYNQHFASIVQPGEEDYTFVIRFSYGENDIVNRIASVYRSTDMPETPYYEYEIALFSDATGRITHSIASAISAFEGNEKDSIVYSYDNQGRINESKRFGLTDGNIQHHIYTFDSNGNRTRIQRFSNDVLQEDMYYQYDNKVNPEVFGDIGILPGQSVVFSPGKNNFIAMEDKVGGSSLPSRNYTYNRHDKPALATLQYGSSSELETLQYLYAP